jgi:fatty-acid desaturase
MAQNYPEPRAICGKEKVTLWVIYDLKRPKDDSLRQETWENTCHLSFPLWVSWEWQRRDPSLAMWWCWLLMNFIYLFAALLGVCYIYHHLAAHRTKSLETFQHFFFQNWKSSDYRPGLQGVAGARPYKRTHFLICEKRVHHRHIWWGKRPSRSVVIFLF